MSGVEIGRPMPRAATKRLVAGRGRYLDDISLKGEVYAAFLRSPHAHASFTITDTAEAAALPGATSLSCGARGASKHMRLFRRGKRRGDASGAHATL